MSKSLVGSTKNPRGAPGTGEPSLSNLALKGGTSLLVRQVIVGVVNLGATIALAWLLVPDDYGIFAYTLPPVMVLALLSDLGLGAALVRVSAGRLAVSVASVFWFEWLVGAIGAALLLVTAQFWRDWYHLGSGLENVLRLHAIILLLLPFRNVGMAHLERNLAFKRVALLEVIESLSAQGCVLLLAWAGAGVYALVAGPIVRAVIGSVGAPLLSGWRPGLPVIDFKVMKPLMHFGVPFQTNNLVNFARDAVLPLVVGSVAGQRVVGYVTWATSVANYPALLLFSLGRIFYPLFVRAGRSIRKLRDAVGWALAASTWGVGLLCVPLFGLADPLVHAVFAPRWYPAIPLFLFLVPINLILASIMPAGAYINSVGRPHVRLIYAVVAGIVLWVGTVATVNRFGMYGYAGSNVAMCLVEAWLLWSGLQELKGLKFPLRPLAASAIAALALWIAATAIGVAGWPGLIGWGLAGGAGFLVLAGRPPVWRG